MPDIDQPIQWGDPPPTKTRGKPRIWEERLAPLRDRPNEWALVATATTGVSARNTAASIRGGLFAGISRHDFQASTRKLADRSYAIWARYVGGE